jgi:hypothetical protein
MRPALQAAAHARRHAVQVTTGAEVPVTAHDDCTHLGFWSAWFRASIAAVTACGDSELRVAGSDGVRSACGLLEQ